MRREHNLPTISPQADYYIYNLDDFKELRDRINNGTEASGTRYPNGTTGYEGKVFAMANDIDFNNYQWEGIGTSGGKRFKGTLDGQFHEILNFKTVDNTSNANNTFFIFSNGGEICNITLSGTYTLTANTQHNFLLSDGNTTYHHIVFNVNVTNTFNMIGCILVNGPCTIVDCYNFGDFTCSSSAYNSGGVFQISGTIERCANYGKISYLNSGRYRTSFFITRRTYDLVIRNCVNYGDMVNADNRNIGICANQAKETTNCLYCGTMSIASVDSGMISNTTPSDSYSNNFYDSTKNTPAYSNGYNGVGMSTADLKSGNNIFSDTTNWVYESGYYPRLNNWLKDDSRVKI